MLSNKDFNREAIIWCYQIFDLSYDDKNENTDLEKTLAVYLNHLVVQDFKLLISILYRIDIDQEKAVLALSKNASKETAGETLARLIIQRQKEKLYYRILYKNKPL